jgi:cytidylate kinase
MVITIDGPAGSGKSTAARRLARELGIAYLDSGATYRAAALKALREGADFADEAALAAAARRADVKLLPEPGGIRVLLDGRDVSDQVRSPEVSARASELARSPEVREVLVGLQRRIGRELGEFVAEGRDQGSVVFPDADVKFYLDADPAVRAQRRQKELQAAGREADHAEVLGSLLQRDERDRSRSAGPLVQPAGAVVVDTSRMTIEEMVAALKAVVEARR